MVAGFCSGNRWCAERFTFNQGIAGTTNDLGSAKAEKMADTNEIADRGSDLRTAKIQMRNAEGASDLGPI